MILESRYTVFKPRIHLSGRGSGPWRLVLGRRRYDDTRERSVGPKMTINKVNRDL